MVAQVCQQLLVFEQSGFEPGTVRVIPTGRIVLFSLGRHLAIVPGT